jgi:hypothetical protein
MTQLSTYSGLPQSTTLAPGAAPAPPAPLSAVGAPVSAGIGVAPTLSTAPSPLGTDPRKVVRKLQRSIELSRKRLRQFRQTRMELLKQYVGRYYDGLNEAKAKAEPINMLFQAVSTLVPNLVFNNPEASIRTESLQLRPFAKVFELACNHLIKRIDLRWTLRQLVVDAVFGIAVAKVGITFGNEVDIGGSMHDVGQPYCDRVSLDDFVYDPAARSLDEATWIGNRYRLPLEYVQTCGLFDNTQMLKPTYCEYGTEQTVPAERLSQGNVTTEELGELVEYVELYDVYIPQNNTTLTLPCDPSQGSLPLREVPWEGPRRGPYEILTFHDVPDNVMPVAIGSVMMDTHLMINKHARKLSRQADRAKNLTIFTPSAENDAKNIQEADDGEMVKVEDVNQVKELAVGGADEKGYKHLQYLNGVFEILSGNSSLLGGVGTPNTGTATEASILNANSSVLLSDKKAQVYAFTARIVEKLAWYLWTDPLIDLKLARRVPGAGEVQVNFSADALEGDFFDYMFTVTPHSMQQQDPQIRLQRIMDFVSKWVIPTAEIAQAQGAMPNIVAISKMMARELAIPEADEMYLMMQPVPQAVDQMGLQPSKGTPMPGAPNVLAGGGGRNPNGNNPDDPAYNTTAGLVAQAYGKPANLGNAGANQ